MKTTSATNFPGARNSFRFNARFFESSHVARASSAAGPLKRAEARAPVALWLRRLALVPAILLAWLLGSSAMGGVLDDWMQRNPGVNGDFRGLGFGNGIYVVVGTQGELLTSSNAIAWTNRDYGGTTWLSDMAYGNNTFVIVGQGGKVLTSTDGISWTPRASGTTANFSEVSFLNGQFIAVGDQASITTSRDGINWMFRNSGISNTNSSQGILYGSCTETAFTSLAGSPAPF